MLKHEEREAIMIDHKGQKIFGMLHRPLNQVQSQGPAVVICHGFAGSKIGKYRIYVLLAECLAKAGITALRFDFRGSGDSEGDFSEMTIDGEVGDALKVIEFLRKDSRVDARRIGLLGNSFGGAIAVLAAKEGNIQSLALLAPLFDSRQWKAKWEAAFSQSSDELAKREVVRALDGNVPGPGFYKGFFQLNLEREVKALCDIPLLHVHSHKDERVGIAQAEEYERCRKGAGGMTKWMRLEKSDHDFSDVSERARVVEEVARWFTETL